MTPTSSFRFFFLIFLLGAFPAFSLGSEPPTSVNTPVFTNKDIEKYKSPSEGGAPAADNASVAAKSGRIKDINEDREKDRWCKKASPLRNNIEKAGDEIQELEIEIREQKDKGLSPGKTEKALVKKLLRAKKQLKFAERDLAEIENEAHRKGVPPGWLRCQFD